MHNTRETDGAPYRTRHEQNVVFFFVAMGVIAITYGIFYFVDFLPEKPGAQETITKEVTTVVTQDEVGNSDADTQGAVDPLPAVIIFDALDGKEVAILNPESSAVDVLDEALLKGVIRHPDSADLVNKGTIFLLGHSSYLPVVKNKNFQAFNGIQKLRWGDTIRLRSGDTEYVYSVERTYQAKATDAEIEIEYGTPTLVLATCNSFATKDDRYVVEASFVNAHKIAK